MGEEIAFENGRISDFQGLVTLTLPYLTDQSYRHASLIDLYQMSLRSKKLFVNGRAYRRTDGHLRPTFLGRLGGVDLNMEKQDQMCRQSTDGSKSITSNEI